MIHRDNIEFILENAPKMPVLCIRGPRQAGKTTLAKLCFPDYQYVGCDRVATKEAIEDDPSTFLRSILATAPGIILDEFQHTPNILNEIRAYVDETGSQGRIVLTGSQNYLMMESVTQSLAGRVILIDLLPLSIHELQVAEQLPDKVYDLMFRGSYPRLYANQTLSPVLVYEDYINTYIERDIQTLKNVPDTSLFHKFLGFCANRTGQLLNVSALASEAQISVALANQWLSLLQTSYMIYFLTSHHVKFNKQLTRHPKLYFCDTGIVCKLLEIESAELLSQHAVRGALFENLVVNECTKWYRAHKRRPPLYFWRDQDGREMDLLIDRAGTLIPIEIKSADAARNTMIEGLSFWHEKTGNPLENSYVVYTGEDQSPAGLPQFVSWKNIPTLLDKLYKPQES